MPNRIVLTEGRIRAAKAEPDGEAFLWDEEVTGFGVRCYGSGRKVYFVQYRAGHSRRASQRRMPIGTFGTVTLADARKIAKARLGEVAAGRDPQAERKEAVRRTEARLDHAIDAYETHLKRRKVVNTSTILATLRRELLGPLGKTDLGKIDRQAIAKQVARLEADGKPGAAQDLRAKATTFLNWSVNRGLAYANPVAGWRRERATRAQVNERKGRALPDAEIKAIWKACDKAPAPFGDFVRTLLLLGQRRGETALMRWQDIKGDIWTIPADVAKNGREHKVPLSPLAAEIIGRQPKWTKCPFVFAGRGKKPMSGWGPRMRQLVKDAEIPFTLHDCRRTFRSGLTRLGVESELAELMLNHARGDLVERYDREPRTVDRALAAQRWAEHITGVVGEAPDRGAVVELAARRA